VSPAEVPVVEAFFQIVQLIHLRGTGTLNSRPQPCVTSFPGVDGGEWTVAANAKPEPVRYEPPDGMKFTIECGWIAVWWNGWLAGSLNNAGGIIAGGEMANEDSLLAAIKKASEAVTP